MQIKSNFLKLSVVLGMLTIVSCNLMSDIPEPLVPTSASLSRATLRAHISTPSSLHTPTAQPTVASPPRATVMAPPSTSSALHTPPPTAAISTAAISPTGIVLPGGSRIVANGGFEQGATAPASWVPVAWIDTPSAFQWEESHAGCSSKCISITNTQENDARFIQSIQVVPGQLYVLSGRIKGENIQGNPVGANLFVEDDDFGHHSGAENSTGTFGWTTVSVTFFGPPSGVVTIGCRLGYYGSTVTGTAYFDDISVEVDKTYRVVEGRTVTLYLEAADSDPSTISPENLSEWVGRLDQAYDEYIGLVGAQPYGGAKIRIMSTRDYPGGWAVAGNPILWHQPYVKDELSLVEREEDWSFGILHEIGHDFDIGDRWNFHAEFFANFKMYYAVSRLNAKVSPTHPVYHTGAGLRDAYQAQIALGGSWWDVLTYRFIIMTDQIGWEPVMKTFRFFLSLPQSDVPQTRLDKFNLFMDKLTEFSGQDTRSWIPADERVRIENELKQ